MKEKIPYIPSAEKMYEVSNDVFSRERIQTMK